MHAKDHGGMLEGERLGRGNIGLDHELFDQPVCLEPLGNDDAGYPAVSIELHLALRQIEQQRFAAVAGNRQGGIGRP